MNEKEHNIKIILNKEIEDKTLKALIEISLNKELNHLGFKFNIKW